MFGEYYCKGGEGESPRLPSPWQALSTSSSSNPSPLALRSPTNSQPGTPINLLSTSPYNELEFEFESLSLDKAEGAIEPEVDKTGHIEYKLKLPCPSPLRLAKLTTQLKWRLVEGGGRCLYEIGVLDNGQIIGLTHEEMKESLDTLGKMLGGLGGGEIKIVKVIRVGGEGRRKATTSGSDSGGESSDGASTSSSSSQSSITFHSFSVDDLPTDLEVFQSAHPLPSPTVNPLAPRRSHASISRHHRSDSERAAIRLVKKEERRLRKEDQHGGPLGTEARPFVDYTQIDIDRAAYRVANPKPLPAPRIPNLYPKQLPTGMKYKPEMGVKEGEVRYAVEAAVLKRNNVMGIRRVSGDLDDELFGGSDEDELVEVEGWTHLDFDSVVKLTN